MTKTGSNVRILPRAIGVHGRRLMTWQEFAQMHNQVQGIKNDATLTYEQKRQQVFRIIATTLTAVSIISTGVGIIGLGVAAELGLLSLASGMTSAAFDEGSQNQATLVPDVPLTLAGLSPGYRAMYEAIAEAAVGLENIDMRFADFLTVEDGLGNVLGVSDMSNVWLFPSAVVQLQSQEQSGPHMSPSSNTFQDLKDFANGFVCDQTLEDFANQLFPGDHPPTVGAEQFSAPPTPVNESTNFLPNSDVCEPIDSEVLQIPQGSIITEPSHDEPHEIVQGQSILQPTISEHLQSQHEQNVCQPVDGEPREIAQGQSVFQATGNDALQSQHEKDVCEPVDGEPANLTSTHSSSHLSKGPVGPPDVDVDVDVDAVASAPPVPPGGSSN